jgi:hypothetical protein
MRLGAAVLAPAAMAGIDVAIIADSDTMTTTRRRTLNGDRPAPKTHAAYRKIKNLRITKHPSLT